MEFEINRRQAKISPHMPTEEQKVCLIVQPLFEGLEEGTFVV